MNPHTTQTLAGAAPLGTAPAISSSGDWRFEALLAAGLIAWSGTGAGACPPSDPPVPPAAPEPPVERALRAPRRAPNAHPDDVEQWVHRHAEEGRDLLATGTQRALRLWNAARLAAWGEDVEPARPQLAVFSTGSDDQAAPRATWTEWAPAQGRPAGRIVVLVHGLDESGFVWDDLAPELAAAGLTAVRFDYSNDQSISHTTDQLAGSLRRLREAGVQRIDLVGHSMGALAIRDLLTRSDLYAGDASAAAAEGLPSVDRFIMLAAPNHGSALAPLQPLSEAREHLARKLEHNSAAGDGWVHSTRDGRGEAAVDLTEGSEFLHEINARPLPTDVRITNIVACMVGSTERQRLRSALKRGLADMLDPEGARAVTGYVDEALDALGDGLVSADSMMLEGVTDTVEVKANHRSMIRRMRVFGDDSAGYTPPAIPIIVNRLAEPQ